MSPAAALALLPKKLRREVDVGFLLVIFVVLDLLKIMLVAIWEFQNRGHELPAALVGGPAMNNSVAENTKFRMHNQPI